MDYKPRYFTEVNSTDIDDLRQLIRSDISNNSLRPGIRSNTSVELYRAIHAHEYSLHDIASVYSNEIYRYEHYHFTTCKVIFRCTDADTKGVYFCDNYYNTNRRIFPFLPLAIVTEVSCVCDLQPEDDSIIFRIDMRYRLPEFDPY